MGNYGSVVELRAIQKEALIVGRGVGDVAGKRKEREDAITRLSHVEALLYLAHHEKGKCKKAALMVLVGDTVKIVIVYNWKVWRLTCSSLFC